MATKERITDEDALRAIEDFDPTGAPFRDATATATIRAAVASRASADAAVTAAVHEARDNGVTWVEIAAALGVTHQGARQRYGQR